MSHPWSAVARQSGRKQAKGQRRVLIMCTDWQTALTGTTTCQSISQLSIMEPMYINAGFLFHAIQEHPKRKKAIRAQREKIFQVRNAWWNGKYTTKDLMRGKIQSQEDQQWGRSQWGPALSKDTGCAMSMRLVSRMASKSLVRICLEEHSVHTGTPGRGNNYFCKKSSQRAPSRWMDKVLNVKIIKYLSCLIGSNILVSNAFMTMTFIL